MPSPVLERYTGEGMFFFDGPPVPGTPETDGNAFPCAPGMRPATRRPDHSFRILLNLGRKLILNRR